MDCLRRVATTTVAYATAFAIYSFLTHQYHAMCNKTLLHHLMFGDSRFCVGMGTMSRSIELAAQTMLGLGVKAS